MSETNLRRLISTIAQSGLFDSGFYLRAYPDVATSGMDPLVHYVLFGRREGRMPNPLFDPAFYADNCVRATGQQPSDLLLHFIESAPAAKLPPHPYFDPAYYLREHPDLAASAVDPLFHFLHIGGFERLRPCPEFDPREYLRWCPEAAQPAINPLVHALEHQQPTLGDPDLAPAYFARSQQEHKLHFQIERLLLDDDGLQVEGWAFQEEEAILSLSVAVENESGKAIAAARLGRQRSDVHDAFVGNSGREHAEARYSGFVTGELPLSASGENRLHLNVELGNEDRATLSFVFGKLSRLGETWQFECLSKFCVNRIESLTSPVKPQWTTQPFARSKRLADSLAVISAVDAGTPPADLPQPVVLVVPVYGGAEHLQPFFASLFMNTRSPHSLVVVDDGNADPAITAYLRAMAAAHANVTLVRGETNRGYVGAMCLAADYFVPGQHVVTLNTDIILPRDWLERLVWPIFRDPTLASTTPLTNAGTVCGFPGLGDNPLYLGLQAETIDAAWAQVRADDCRIELPSGVGFCMAHNRAAIDRIGWYDAAAFGKGYGEENDWCLRARLAGFRNVLVPNLFVYHKHGGSFRTEEKRLLSEASLAVVNERYPQYGAEVEAFYRADPLRPVRALVAMFLAVRHRRGSSRLLFDRDSSGGAHLFRKHLVEQARADGGCVVLVLWSGRASSFQITLFCEAVEHSWRKSSLDDVVHLARLLAFDEIIVNHLAELPDLVQSLETIGKLAAASGARTTIYIHDYFTICPSPHLLDNENRFCGVPVPEACAACAPRNDNFLIDRSARQGFSIVAWRATFSRFLAAAHRVICFSRDSAERLGQVYGDAAAKTIVLPHYLQHFAAPRGFAVPTEAGLRIGVIGAINAAKGAEIVLDLARAIRQRAPNGVHLTVIGELDADYPPGLLTVTGPYQHKDLAWEILRHRINMALIPSIVPETFGYVVEEAMNLDLPVAVFDLGAPAERVRIYRKGLVLSPCGGGELLDALCAFGDSLRPTEGDEQPRERRDVSVLGRTVRPAATSPGGGRAKPAVRRPASRGRQRRLLRSPKKRAGVTPSRRAGAGGNERDRSGGWTLPIVGYDD